MSTNGRARRLSALEALAEQARRRELWPEVLRLAREHEVDPERVWELGEELRRERERIKAAGGRPADYLAYLLERVGAEGCATSGLALEAIERAW
jgi:hypothetical protein